MRFIATLAVAASALTANAWAQATTAPAIPPSACAALTQAPAPPDGATVTDAQIRAAVAAFETWRVNEQVTLDCRRAEVETLNAQSTARTTEYRDAQADNTARAAAFQAQIDIFQARPARERR